MHDVVTAARELAHRAHAGQVDKAGAPYIEHVERVAAAVSDDPVAEAVALVHDLLEDCPGFEEEFWATLPAAVTGPAEKLARISSQPNSLYYSRIRRCPIALRVKLADIDDNSAESRLALLDAPTVKRLRRKYSIARKALDGDVGIGVVSHDV